MPCLGLCLGLHAMTVEFARHVLGLAGANSTEFDPTSKHPVIDLMLDQRDITDKGGTMRLGAYYAVLAQGTKVAEAYGEPVVSERHRHRYEFNSNYKARYEAAGFVCSGTSPDKRLVEFIELADHPYWVATQAHPEFKSRPDRPHPLFRELIGAALARRAARLVPTRANGATCRYRRPRRRDRTSRDGLPAGRRTRGPSGLRLAGRRRRVRGARRRAIPPRHRALARCGRRRTVDLRRRGERLSAAGRAVPTAVRTHHHRDPRRHARRRRRAAGADRPSGADRGSRDEGGPARPPDRHPAVPRAHRLGDDHLPRHRVLAGRSATCTARRNST